jgi:hypothetical protein
MYMDCTMRLIWEANCNSKYSKTRLYLARFNWEKCCVRVAKWSLHCSQFSVEEQRNSEIITTETVRGKKTKRIEDTVKAPAQWLWNVIRWCRSKSHRRLKCILKCWINLESVLDQMSKIIKVRVSVPTAVLFNVALI